MMGQALSARSSHVEEDALAPEVDRRISILFEIARFVASQHDLEAMPQGLLDCLSGALEAEAGLLLLCDPPGKYLKVEAAQGYDLAALKPLRLARNEVIDGSAWQASQVTVHATLEAVAAARDCLTPEHRAALQDAATDRGLPDSALTMPLVAGADRVGALLLENRRRPGRWAEMDLTFLGSLGNLAALAITNARQKHKLWTEQYLGEANLRKAELLSTLAHEMRTPLTSIKGYSTALLLEEASFNPETQQEFLHIIDEECDVLESIVHDLLESSIIDAGLLRLEPEPVLLPRLVKGVIDDISRRSRGYHFVVDFPASFPVVEADPHRIVQVLTNLLDNAVKYSAEGTTIVTRGRVHPDEVEVSVADQGIGIAPEHLNRLFEKFFRAASGRGHHVVGSGLGLPIAHTIVEGHGGRIWAESQLGHGSTLFFTLPLVPVRGELADFEEEQDE
jgi:signal transduction histidine kinase